MIEKIDLRDKPFCLTDNVQGALDTLWLIAEKLNEIIDALNKNQRKNMKRYNVIDTGVYMWLEEAEDGEWVKYKDVEKEMKRIWNDIMPPPSDILKALCKGA